jgi:SpoVK/Ycf46/Vps4 family AAA+-type ATPase
METPMLSRIRHQSLANPTLDFDRIVLLWILRLLVPLGGHREFINEAYFSDDGLAKAIGLGHWLELDVDFDRGKILRELHSLHRQVESNQRDAYIPEVLRHNACALSELVGLDNAARSILEFAVVLNNTPLLNTATNMVGQISSASLYRVLALLLDLTEEDVKNALSSKGQLACSGLITVDHCGSDDISSKLDLLTPSLPARMTSSTEDPLNLLREVIVPCNNPELSLIDFQHIRQDLSIALPYLCQAVAKGYTGINIFIHGAPGTGKSQLARTFAQELDYPLFEVAREDSDGDPITSEARLRALRAAQNVLAKRKSLLLFDEVEDVFGDDNHSWYPRSTAQARKGWVNQILESNPVPTLWLSNSTNGLDNAFVRRFDMVFELPIPPRHQREQITRKLCGDILPADTVSRLVDAESLAPAVVERAAKVVNAISDRLPGTKLPAAMEHLINNTLVTQGHSPLKKHDPNRLPAWYDLSFINSCTDLESLIKGLRHTQGGRLCVYGPPGTGKTAFGRWLAERLEMPLLVRRGSDLLSMWQGGTEQNIARAFRQAESENALLLIDEMDGFLQDRRSAHRPWEVTQVNEMLTQLESYPGIFVATTNLMDGLDQAALRRFDLKLKLDYLLPIQAWQMFTRQCVALGLPSPDISLRGRLSGLTVLTPGDFATLARQHRFRPFATARELLDALDRECAAKEDGRRRRIGFI